MNSVNTNYKEENLSDKKLVGKLFVASYSGGKDSVLALYRAINAGMIPIAIMTTYQRELERSWFHGVPGDVLESISRSLSIPIWLIETNGDDYNECFEVTLQRAKEQGAEYCVFGDIDIAEHHSWCDDRCNNVGISSFFPLWNENRKSLVTEFLEAGFITRFTVIHRDKINTHYLGMSLSKDILDAIEATGADCCGEQGEYHTLVTAGPLFKLPVELSFGAPMQKGDYDILPITGLVLPRLGRYRHFKGMEYQLLYIATNSETLEKTAVYQALYGEHGVWVRPLSMWEEMVVHEGKPVKRFTFVE